MLRIGSHCQSSSKTICAQVMHLKDVFVSCQADTFSCIPKGFASGTCIAKDNVKSLAAVREHLGRTVGEPLGEAEAEQEGKLGKGTQDSCSPSGAVEPQITSAVPTAACSGP